jgi:hypothetical protein
VRHITPSSPPAPPFPPVNPAGLRVEFPVPNEVLGLVIGRQGSNIDRVTEETGVERIAVDSESDPKMVRIKGPTRESVAKARKLLEYTVITIQLTQKELQYVLGKDSSKINEVRAKSRVLKIDFNENKMSPNECAIIITGIKSEAETAELLIRASRTRRATDSALRARGLTPAPLF